MSESQSLTIWQEIAKRESQIKALLPRHVSLPRFIQTAQITIGRTPQLMEADRGSLMESLLRCAELGLEVSGPLGHAYLLPFRDHGSIKCQLIIGYRGYIKLMLQSGRVKKVEARAVFESDDFRHWFGTDPGIRHVPSGEHETEPDKLTHAYAVATLEDGVKQFDVMTRKEIERIRAMSKTATNPNGPWAKHFIEQAKKTVIRRLSKVMDQSPELALANSFDDDSPEFEVSGEVVSRQLSGIEEAKRRMSVQPVEMSGDPNQEGTDGSSEEEKE